MSPEITVVFNLFMMTCFCWISYNLGQIKEMDRQSALRREKFTEDMIKIYKSRRI